MLPQLPDDDPNPLQDVPLHSHSLCACVECRRVATLCGLLLHVGLSRSPQLRTNSALCERVFALLRNLFGEKQVNALSDYLQASLMLNYNHRFVG